MVTKTHEPAAIMIAFRRGAARLMDFMLGYLVWIAIVYFCLYQLMERDSGLGSDVGLLLHVLIVLGVPVSFLLEGVWYRLWGNTPGKRLYALRVVDLNEKVLSSDAYQARLIRLYCTGVMLGIPVLAQWSISVQCFSLLTRGATTYDEGHYQVLHDTPEIRQLVLWPLAIAGLGYMLWLLLKFDAWLVT